MADHLSFWRRRPDPASTELVPSAPRLRTSILWEISQAIGKVAGGVVLVITALALLSHPLHLKERFDSIFQGTFFKSAGDSLRSGGEHLHSAVVEGVKTQSRELPDVGEDASAYFALGASREEVERIQGKPTRAGDEVWEYGDARVYFAKDRVIGWTNGAGAPLKAR